MGDTSVVGFVINKSKNGSFRRRTQKKFNDLNKKYKDTMLNNKTMAQRMEHQAIYISNQQDAIDRLKYEYLEQTAKQKGETDKLVSELYDKYTAVISMVDALFVGVKELGALLDARIPSQPSTPNDDQQPATAKGRPSFARGMKKYASPNLTDIFETSRDLEDDGDLHTSKDDSARRLSGLFGDKPAATSHTAKIKRLPLQPVQVVVTQTKAPSAADGTIREEEEEIEGEAEMSLTRTESPAIEVTIIEEDPPVSATKKPASPVKANSTSVDSAKPASPVPEKKKKTKSKVAKNKKDKKSDKPKKTKRRLSEARAPVAPKAKTKSVVADKPAQVSTSANNSSSFTDDFSDLPPTYGEFRKSMAGSKHPVLQTLDLNVSLLAQQHNLSLDGSPEQRRRSSDHNITPISEMSFSDFGNFALTLQEGRRLSARRSSSLLFDAPPSNPTSPSVSAPCSPAKADATVVPTADSQPVTNLEKKKQKRKGKNKKLADGEGKLVEAVGDTEVREKRQKQAKSLKEPSLRNKMRRN